MLSSTTFSGSIHNPFNFEDQDRGFSPSKRTKYSRRSGEWRFIDRSPSPIEERQATDEEEHGDQLQSVHHHETVDERSLAYEAIVNQISEPEALVAEPTASVKPDVSQKAEQIRSRNDAREAFTSITDQDGVLHTMAAENEFSASATPQSDEPQNLIQDTYEPETWSTPPTKADPIMDNETHQMLRESHSVGRDTASPSASSTRKFNTLSNHDRSRSAAGWSDSASDVQGTGSDIDGLESEPYDAEPFSKREYVPSESDHSSLMESRHSEEVESMSPGVEDVEEYSGPSQNLKTQAAPIAAESTLSHYFYDNGFDGSIISRPKRVSRPISPNLDQAIGQTRISASHIQGHRPVTFDEDLDKQISPEHVIDEATVEALTQSQLVNEEGSMVIHPVPGDEEQRANFQTRCSPQFDASQSDPEATQVSNGSREIMNSRYDEFSHKSTSPANSSEEDEQRLSRINNKMSTHDNPLNGKLDEHSTIEWEPAKHGDQSSDKENVTHGRGRHPAQPVNANEIEGIEEPNEDPYLYEALSEHGRRGALLESKGPILPKHVEIIDVDKYEPSALVENYSGSDDSENEDYWSEEEYRDHDDISLEYEEEKDNEIEDATDTQFLIKDDLEDEEELLSADERSFEEEMMPAEAMSGQDLVSSSLYDQQVGENQPVEVECSTVDIIDIESNDQDHPDDRSFDRNHRPQPPSNDTETDLCGKAVDLADAKEESDNITYKAPLDPFPNPDVKVEQDSVIGSHTEVLSPARSNRGVQDTYLEDDVVSDMGPSDISSAGEANGEIPLSEIDDSRVTVQEPAVHQHSNTPAAEQDTENANQQRPVGADVPETLLQSFSQGERLVTRPKGDSSNPALPLAKGNFTSLTTPSTLIDVCINPLTDKVKESRIDIAIDNTNAVAHLSSDDTTAEKNDSSSRLLDGRSDGRDVLIQDVRNELNQSSQLPTPTDTQTTKIFRDPSDISKISQDEQHTLPTPTLTQRMTEDLLPPATPILPRKPSLVEKLKEMRSESARKRQASLDNDVHSVVSPWFGISRSSQIAPSSDQEGVISQEEETGRDGDISSEAEQSGVYPTPSLPRGHVGSPAVDASLVRLPSSSPAPPPEPMAGFRTSLSYFAPLNTLRSHYNATTSTLVLVISSTPIDRATTGPKDYHETLYVTDPSASSPLSVTLARIFRHSKFPFPAATQGDAILLRDFRVVSYRKQLGLLSTESSAWAVFRRGEEPQIRGPPVEFGAEERGFARGLWDWWSTVDHEEYVDAVPLNSPGRKRKGHKKINSRSSVVKHELRDGTTYVDRPRNGNNEMHELRDGTVWSDSKL